MPNVNLIAARRQDKKRLERNTRRLFVGLAAETAALALLGMMVAVQQFQLRAAIGAANADLARLQPTLNRIHAIEDDLDSLRPRIQTLRTARADTLRWRALFQMVSQSLPANAWLTSIAASSSDTPTDSSGGSNASTGDDPAAAAAPPVVLTIVGTAGSQTLVGETMSRLGAYPAFETVELRFTRSANESAPASAAGAPPRRVDFEIGARLKSSAPAADNQNSVTAAANVNDGPQQEQPQQQQQGAQTRNG